jgi:hypothetical protein
MKIGIIGAGNIGGALTRRFRELGHEVCVANSRGPETLAELAAETGARAVSVEDAARGNDVVIVTIPEAKVSQLPADLFDGVGREVVVVDTGNYYPQQRDGRIEGIEAGLTESRWVAQQLERDVIKAFNNIYAETESRRVLPGASRFPLPATTPQRRRSSCGSSMNSGSIRSTPARSTNRGASSPDRRSTRTITTQTAFEAVSRARRRIALRPGAGLPRVREPSRNRRNLNARRPDNGRARFAKSRTPLPER